jgi:Flp pilus assembly protein CpaB
VLVGIALVAAAAAMVLVAHRSANRPPRHRWLVAVAEVPVGTPLGRHHLGTAPIDLPRGVQAVAATDLEDVLGRVTARPLADGQLLTPDDLLAAGRFDGGDGIEVTVTLDERRWPGGGLDVGDRVDVLSTDPDGEGTRPLVSRARLVALDDGDGAAGLGGDGGTRVRLAVPDAAAATALVDAAVREQLTVVLPAPSSTTPPSTTPPTEAAP